MRKRRLSVAIAGAAGLTAVAILWLAVPSPEKTGDREDSKSLPNHLFPDVRFVDVTEKAGIHFRHTNGASGELLMPELFGSGCAFFDYDNDGDQDLLLINSSYLFGTRPADEPLPTTALYRNDGRGKFDDVTQESGLDAVLYGMGVAIGDFDADGWRDVYITAVGENRLFHNLGEGRFEDVTNAIGVGGDEKRWSTSCGWFDYDNDGDLDLFVCSYVKWSRQMAQLLDHTMKGVPSYIPPHRFEGAHCLLYRNNGSGRFTDVSKSSGVQVKQPDTGRPAAKALGVCGYDIDQDGWLDLIIANDQAPNFLLHNQRNGTFQEIALLAGLAFDRNGHRIAGMGVDVNELPGDLGLGIAIGNISNAETPFFVSPQTRFQFVDIVPETGLAVPTQPMTTFGLIFFDYDLDGRLDMLQANGSINTPEGSAVEGFDYKQSSQLFWFSGRREAPFTLVPASKCGEALHQPIMGRGAAYADIDGDGDLDVVITQNGGPVSLLRNDQQLGHHWIRLKLISGGMNRNAIGARIQVRLGKQILHRQIRPTRSYLSQVELPVTIGLGLRGQADDVRIIWPDGSIQVVEDFEIDRLTVIKKATID